MNELMLSTFGSPSTWGMCLDHPNQHRLEDDDYVRQSQLCNLMGKPTEEELLEDAHILELADLYNPY